MSIDPDQNRSTSSWQ